MSEQLTPSFEQELTNLLNKHGIDAEVGLHDFLLAAYLHRCVRGLQSTLKDKNRHEGKEEHDARTSGQEI